MRQREKGNKMKKEDEEKQKKEFFKEAKRRTQQMRNELVNNASFHDADKIRDRLYRMIQYSIGRQDWYDNQQHRMLNIGIAFVAASFALGTFILAISSDVSLLTAILGGLTALCTLGTGASLIFYYNRGLARDHPYRKIVDIRSWYFIYNFPSGLKDEIGQGYEEAKKHVEETIDAYKVFLERWLEYCPDPNKFIEEDLEQVFILQILQRYRYQAVKTMSRMLYYGIWAIVVFGIASIISYVCYATIG
jgi:hypothetical protein